MTLQEIEKRDESGASYRAMLADQKAATRKRILSAARPVFLRDGFLDANLNEVAQAAGVGKGTLYRHFENKGDLYIAVLSEHGDHFIESLRAAVDLGANAITQIERIARFYVDYWVAHPEHFKIVWAMQNRDLIGPLSPDLVAQVRALFEAPMRILESLIRGGVERGELRPCHPWNLANGMALSVNALVGQILNPIASPIDRDPRAVCDEMIGLVLSGLAKPA